MWRVVLDTNLFVSSLLVREGRPAQVLAAWRQQRYVLVTSAAIIDEIRSTLAYPRIRLKYRLTDEDVAQLVVLLEEEALVVPGTADVAGAVPDDPQDEMVLACALDGRADRIVSGDRHLLDLGVYRGIPIVTAREFLEQLEAIGD
jgi:putative PIN family toxin of toxin-antitoxin system